MPARKEAKHARVDLSGEVCPMSFIKAKLVLAKMRPGEEVEFVVRPDEQIVNLPESIRAEGHSIESVERVGNRCRLLVRKQG